MYLKLIAQATSDEDYNVKYGEMGDQNGSELNCKLWYTGRKRRWGKVYRFADSEIVDKIVRFMTDAVTNGAIGYSQSDRRTFYNQCIATNFNPIEIVENCACDCSCLMYCAILNATGVPFDDGDTIPTVKRFDEYFAKLRLAGFDFLELTDRQYLDSPDYLIRGDILRTDYNYTTSYHVCCWV